MTTGVAAAIGLFLVTVLYVNGPMPSSGSGGLAVRLAPSPTVGYAPLTVTLVATVTGGTPPYQVTWTSGATLIGSGSTSVASFASPGNQTVTARAVDATGAAVSASTVVGVVSPFPQAEGFVPPQHSVNTDLLAIDWHASQAVSSCTLASWGTIGVPTFAGCGAAGGEVHAAATGEAVVFQADPDDPEATPILFQSSASGVLVTVAWWFNDTSPVQNEQSGTITLVTAVQPL